MCLMGLYPSEYLQEIEANSKAGIQIAANKLQWAIVDGLEENNIDVSIINSLYIDAYPKNYYKRRIPTFKFHHKPNAEDLNVGFNNTVGLKWFSRYYGLKKALRNWAILDCNNEKFLLVYALSTPFANVVKYVKRKFKNIKVCIVVPDLPEYMNVKAMKSNLIYRVLKNIEIKMIKNCIKNVDSYVLLTDAMKSWFDRDINYTVVEGVAVNSIDDYNCTKNKTILYAGGIKEEYGIIDLIKAFIAVDNKEWELDIYGDGADLIKAKELAKNHTNIVFKGMVSNSVVVEEQKKASLLINPRKNHEFTKYSFPSKVLEYMSSGTPMLGYKLDGIPKEYSDYYYVIEDVENGLEIALKNAMSLTDEERKNYGYKAKKFVEDNKNAKSQCAKIVDLLKSL